MTTRRQDHGRGAPGNPATTGDTEAGKTPGRTLVRSLGEPADLTYTVSLPVVVHDAPDDEMAVAIADVPIIPVYLDAMAPSTMSISVVTADSLTVPEIADFGPVIPALPEADEVCVRRPAPRRITATATASAAAPDAKKLRKPIPEGTLQRFLYSSTFHLVNVGDSYAERQRKALEARIAARFTGGTRFVPVLSRKGGVGATTVTALMGMAFADVRDDRVIAIDTNPDRGTLAERVTKTTRSTVRDVISRSGSITSQAEFESMASRDETGLDVLASDGTPDQAQPLGEDEFNVVADIASRYDSIAVTDGGTGILHAAARAALQRADAVVVVSGGSVDEARSASELLTWLETNGYAELASNAILALNTATVGTNLDKVEEIEAHFLPRVREIVRIPYDPMLATGSVIHYHGLKPFTRDAARDLAALVADGLSAGQDA